MKRLTALLLSVIMLLSLTACGGADAPAPTDATASATIPTEGITPTEAEITEPSAPENLLGNDMIQLFHKKPHRLRPIIFPSSFILIVSLNKQILKRKYNMQKFHKTHAGNSNENSISKGTFD